jgi:Domain of unknown function (DUF4249)
MRTWKSISIKTTFLFLFLLTNCVEPFPLTSIDYNELMVVEGLITDESKQHKVTLSRTSKLNELVFIPEKGATVKLQVNNGFIIPLTETSPGIYFTPQYAGTIGTAYKLLITTSDNKEYISKEVLLKPTPAIEKVYAKYPVINSSGEKGVQIYLDTEDQTNQTRFYRWEYEETYEIKTPYPSKFVWLGGNNITFRVQAVDNCWASDTSSNVIISTTKAFVNDRVTSLPLKFISSESPELVIKYSLLVKQYALTEEAYLFWKQLKNVNETQGSLFDIQPGEVNGNIFSIDNKAKVLGYFDAASASTKRSFFTAKDFEASGYTPPQFLQSCLETAPIEISIEQLGATMEIYQKSLAIYEALGAGPSSVLLLRIVCCDCTSKGTNVKPAFWE